MSDRSTCYQVFFSPVARGLKKLTSVVVGHLLADLEALSVGEAVAPLQLPAAQLQAAHAGLDDLLGGAQPQQASERPVICFLHYCSLAWCGAAVRRG